MNDETEAEHSVRSAVNDEPVVSHGGHLSGDFEAPVLFVVSMERLFEQICFSRRSTAVPRALIEKHLKPLQSCLE